MIESVLIVQRWFLLFLLSCRVKKKDWKLHISFSTSLTLSKFLNFSPLHLAKLSTETCHKNVSVSFCRRRGLERFAVIAMDLSSDHSSKPQLASDRFPDNMCAVIAWSRQFPWEEMLQLFLMIRRQRFNDTHWGKKEGTKEKRRELVNWEGEGQDICRPIIVIIYYFGECLTKPDNISNVMLVLKVITAMNCSLLLPMSFPRDQVLHHCHFRFVTNLQRLFKRGNLDTGQVSGFNIYSLCLSRIDQNRLDWQSWNGRSSCYSWALKHELPSASWEWGSMCKNGLVLKLRFPSSRLGKKGDHQVIWKMH